MKSSDSVKTKKLGGISLFAGCSLLVFVWPIILSLVVLLAKNGYSAQVTLAWDSNTEQKLAGYKIYVGSASRAYDYSIDVGNKTSYTVSGLADGKTYYFAVTVYDKNGNESGYSKEVIWTSPPANHPPVTNDGSLTTPQNTAFSYFLFDHITWPPVFWRVLLI